jgi:hypothetical protein
MRRVLALIAAVVLVASLAGSSLAAGNPPKNSFTGDFDVIDPDSGVVVGHVVAQLSLPSDRRLVPGTYEFKGAAGYPIQETRAVVANTLFWIDPNGGMPHAMATGAVCDINNPGEYICHGDWAVMFRVVPGEPNSILFTTCRVSTAPDGFDFSTENGCATLLTVGKGAWVLKVAPE